MLGSAGTGAVPIGSQATPGSTRMSSGRMSGIASGTPEASAERNAGVGSWMFEEEPADDTDASISSGTTRSAAHFGQ
jgi:hypothetical protein